MPPLQLHALSAADHVHETCHPSHLLFQVNAGTDSLKTMCEEIGVPKLPYFHFLKGDNGIVAEFAANLTAQKLQQLRAQVALHSAQ